MVELNLTHSNSLGGRFKKCTSFGGLHIQIVLEEGSLRSALVLEGLYIHIVLDEGLSSHIQLAFALAGV